MKKLLALALMTGAGAIGAAAILYAPTAHADESTFLNSVAAHGVPVNQALLGVGHEVCTSASTNGTAGLDTEGNAALEAGLTPHDSAVIIVEAIHELCPSNLPALHAWLATPVSVS
jgi:hypothetical protein